MSKAKINPIVRSMLNLDRVQTQLEVSAQIGKPMSKDQLLMAADLIGESRVVLQNAINKAKDALEGGE